ncbi:hypothetical protein [Cutibacterium sp. V970]|uniref:hypothetical protein n=1 Tax=Cutibacterium sp. V970 TaxID=3446481 RepID=UPI003EE2E61E
MAEIDQISRTVLATRIGQAPIMLVGILLAGVDQVCNGKRVPIPPSARSPWQKVLTTVITTP